MTKVAEKRDTIPAPTREEEHEEGIANDDWLELADWQARRVASELMILRSAVEATGGATPAQWAAVEEPLRELWRAVERARREQRPESPRESGAHLRAGRAGR